jgi:hypothetical protein
MGTILMTEDERIVLNAFKEYLDCRIRELVNNRLNASDLTDRINTTEAEKTWIAEMEKHG